MIFAIEYCLDDGFSKKNFYLSLYFKSSEFGLLNGWLSPIPQIQSNTRRILLKPCVPKKRDGTNISKLVYNLVVFLTVVAMKMNLFIKSYLHNCIKIFRTKEANFPSNWIAIDHSGVSNKYQFRDFLSRKYRKSCLGDLITT